MGKKLRTIQAPNISKLITGANELGIKKRGYCRYSYNS